MALDKITSTMITDEAVTTAKLGPSAVTGVKIASDAIDITDLGTIMSVGETAPAGPFITLTRMLRCRAALEDLKMLRHGVCVRRYLKKRQKTEFRTIFEMGLREANPHHAAAVLAYGSLEDTHTEHLAESRVD